MVRGPQTESKPEAKTIERGPTPLQSRPADHRLTHGHPEAWPETAPKNPTVAIPSFEIRSTDPDPTGGPHPEGIPNS